MTSEEKKLRRYQERAVEAFDKWISPLNKNNLATIILPTGTGKTFTTACCVQHLDIKIQKVLWCAHREELITQAAEELAKVNPEAVIELEMADNRASPDADIIVGTVQTLHRYRKNIHGFYPFLTVIDEYHHYDENNKTYHGLMERYPESKFLGLTATPYRFSGGVLPLGETLMEMDIGVAVAHDYLVPPKPEVLKTNVSLAHVRTRAGDFAIDDLSKAVNVDNRNVQIAKRIFELVKDEKRQGLLFGVDVAHAKAMTAILSKEVRAAEIYGETPKEERREIMTRVRNGEVDVLVNNLIAVEGFDIPHMSFVGMARPTKSLGLYVQATGRGLRKSVGKKDCVIIDVFDKVKITQKRVAFFDMAAASDLDGSERAIETIISEVLPDKLKNFPVFMLDSLGHWVIDNETWEIPSWILAPNHWIIAWSKREERVESGDYEYNPFKYTPSQFSLDKTPIPVSHNTQGEGLLVGINSTLLYPTCTVIFAKEKIEGIPLFELNKKTKAFERKKLDKPIKRAFYVCMDATSNRGRIISLLQENEQDKEFKVLGSAVGDKTTLNEMIKVAAEQDDLLYVLKGDAKWRSKPVSDKQKALIKRFISWGKLEDDLDLDSMTGGEASAILDQINWGPLIKQLFGTTDRKKLKGYLAMQDDV